MHHTSGAGRHHVRQQRRYPRLSMVRQGSQRGHRLQDPFCHPRHPGPHLCRPRRHPHRRLQFHEHVRWRRFGFDVHFGSAAPQALFRERPRPGDLVAFRPEPDPLAHDVGPLHLGIPDRGGPACDGLVRRSRPSPAGARLFSLAHSRERGFSRCPDLCPAGRYLPRGAGALYHLLRLRPPGPPLWPLEQACVASLASHRCQDSPHR